MPLERSLIRDTLAQYGFPERPAGTEYYIDERAEDVNYAKHVLKVTLTAALPW